MKTLVTGSLAAAALRRTLNSQAKNPGPSARRAQPVSAPQAASIGEDVPLVNALSSSAAA